MAHPDNRDFGPLSFERPDRTRELVVQGLVALGVSVVALLFYAVLISRLAS